MALRSALQKTPLHKNRAQLDFDTIQGQLISYKGLFQIQFNLKAKPPFALFPEGLSPNTGSAKSGLCPETLLQKESTNSITFEQEDSQAPSCHYQNESHSFSFDFGLGLGLEESPGHALSYTGEQLIWHLKLDKEDRILGLGEKTGPLNKRGRVYTHWNTDVFGYGPEDDPLYATWPFLFIVKPKGIVGLYMDNPAKSHFDFGATMQDMLSIHTETGGLNAYLFAGQNMQEVLNTFYQITGKPALMPKWSAGIHQSRYSYFPQDRVALIAESYRRQGFPLDALHLDIHYMQDFKSFTFHNERFPNPGQLIEKLQKQGIEPVCIIDPGIKIEEGYPPYEDLEEEEVVQLANGQALKGSVWPGACLFPDFLQEPVRSKYQSWLKFYTDLGIKGLWNDMNEPAMWGQQVPITAKQQYAGQSMAHLQVRNLYGFSMAKATYEGSRAALQGERPWVLTRSAYCGAQQYATIWTGDNSGTDEHMMAGIRLLLSLSISGFGHCGMDIGGFSSEPSTDLYVRWVSIGVFTPFFRIHSMIDSRSREPWSFGETAGALCRNYMQLRYRLMPLLYTAFLQHHENGQPIMEPLAYRHPHDHKIYEPHYQHQYYFAQQLMVAPAAASARQQSVYFPQQAFYNFYTDERYEANSETQVEAPLSRLPLFVPAGGMIPLQSPVQSTKEAPEKTLELHLYHGEGSSEWTLIEDDGISLDPQRPMKRSLFRWEGSTQCLKIQVQEKGFQAPFRRLRVVFHGFPSFTDTLQNQLQDYTFKAMEEPPHFDPFYEPEDQYPSLKLKALEMGYPDSGLELKIS